MIVITNVNKTEKTWRINISDEKRIVGTMSKGKFVSHVNKKTGFTKDFIKSRIVETTDPIEITTAAENKENIIKIERNKL